MTLNLMIFYRFQGKVLGGGPLNTQDPDPFDWDLPDGMEKYGESPYL